MGKLMAYRTEPGQAITLKVENLGKLLMLIPVMAQTNFRVSLTFLVEKSSIFVNSDNMKIKNQNRIIFSHKTDSE
jgi:hypothetical protein